jgi:peptidoglycan/LPS O-acetylase OafA/YrhL
MTTALERSPRIPALDGLRGIAILAVLAFHADVLFGGAYGLPGSHLLSRVIGAGWLGVDLFFVLSGFLITTILLERKATEGAGRFFPHFYARRALRIFPLYYGFLLLYFAVLRFRPAIDPGYPITARDTWSFLLFFYNNRSALHDFAVPNLNMYWTLCVEEQFYVVWPLLVWILSARALQRTCVGVAGLVLLFRLVAVRLPHGFPLAAFATPGRLDGLALGSLVALLRQEPRLWAAVSRWAGRLLVVLGLAVAGIAISQGHFYSGLDFRLEHPPLAHDSRLVQTWGLTAAVWFFAALLVFVLAGKSRPAVALGRVLSWAPLRSLGFFSYAMYMFHRVIFHLLDYYIVQKLPPYAENQAVIAKLLAILVLAAVSYGAARISYVIWERPFLRLRGRWVS